MIPGPTPRQRPHYPHITQGPERPVRRTDKIGVRFVWLTGGRGIAARGRDFGPARGSHFLPSESARLPVAGSQASGAMGELRSPLLTSCATVPARGLRALGTRCEALACSIGLAFKVLQIGRVFHAAPRAAFDLVEMRSESIPCFWRFYR